MKHECGNAYRMCRVSAELSQSDAAELLDCSERTLSDYENGHTVPPDDMVDRMVKVYRAPMLAWAHLKQNSTLGKYLPDISMPQTYGDMAFQLVLAYDALGPAVDAIKIILADRKVDDHELEDFIIRLAEVQNISCQLISTVVYAKQLGFDLDTKGCKGR